MSRSKLDLNLLETFDAVCLAGSLKRAAENLHMTQSAVSMQMKRLEEAVDQQLLDRSARGLSVTPAGERELPGLDMGKQSAFYRSFREHEHVLLYSDAAWTEGAVARH